ncbi:TetR/AcrR family transcriptional regulator [Mycolicibacterium sp. CBMA 226]|uniref:TetR/AcrR family transcriptional regulator n=1 Tax=Mycolicibacterium sp. CBMA 226 TaxID=2606611 RepID=UPI0012DF6781|nr:TetR/AcrR family transcriptional regulator [Mycolicibacterium sp. CBMA 226]MUL77116.1 TetR/AcrR family transcriptional regulator [Mycolicibacterium sp. CBMA 226]
MARWEPNARERLEEAALELFAEQGYDSTSVAQIADRAGLAKSTFFRHFADKREVLSAGQEILADLFAEGTAATPPSATPAECISAALQSAAAVFTPQRHHIAALRRSVVAANSELQERELLKRARLVAVLTDALSERGADETVAHLAAEIGMLAFGMAFARWSALESCAPFGPIADAALGELLASATTLGNRATSPRHRGD